LTPELDPDRLDESPLERLVAELAAASRAT
jgi:hypothetical protein